jgi:septum formation protein
MPAPLQNLILASSSVYRRQLLERLTADFSVAPADIDETPLAGEDPAALAERLAAGKAAAIADAYPDALIIGSDQVAACAGTALGKPGNHENAAQQLALCSGREVEFFTAVCVVRESSGFSRTHTDRTVVRFRDLAPDEIDSYLRKDQPWNCAGSFRSEGLGVVLFESIQSTDPTALIGLPLIWLSHALQQGGIELL